MLEEFEELLKASLGEGQSEETQNLLEFTDEERYGHFLDLHDCYLKYINLQASERLDYITYLSIFDQLTFLKKECRVQALPGDFTWVFSGVHGQSEALRRPV